MNAKELMEKVAQARPQHHAFLLKTAKEVKESPFKDEIASELDSLMKEAMQMPPWGSKMMGNAMGGAGAVGGAVAMGIAYSLAGDMYDAAKRGITKSRNYKNMLMANPDLKQLPAKDVQKAFSVLHHFNPEFSGDPNVAGAWVKRQATFGEDGLGDSSQLKQLIDSRKAITETRKLPSVPERKKGDMGGKPMMPNITNNTHINNHMPDQSANIAELIQKMQANGDADAQDFFSNLKMHPMDGGGHRSPAPKK